MHHTNQGSREIPQGNASSLSELITRTKFRFVSILTAETVLFPRKQEIKMQQRWTDRTHGNTWKNRNMILSFVIFILFLRCFRFLAYRNEILILVLHMPQYMELAYYTCRIHKLLSGKTSITVI